LKESTKQRIKMIEDIDVFRENVLSFVKDSTMEMVEKEIMGKFIDENREHMHYLLESKDLDSEGHFIGAYPFVEEVMNKYSKRVPMVSFSGGKDSTVVSHIVRKATNNQSVLHIFGDTTLELPLTYKYVEEFKLANPSTPFFDEKNEENDFFDMCKEIGPPSRVKSWCCSIFKTGPMGTTLSNFEEDFLTFYGVRRKESASRSKYEKVSKTPKIHGGLVTSPVIDWLDLDIWLYLLSEEIQYNKSYKLGFPRVGCWMCPNNSDISQFLAKLYVIKNKENEMRFDSIDWENFLYDFGEKIVKNYSENQGKKLSPIELQKEVENYVGNNKWKARQGGEGLEKGTSGVVTKKECINEKNTYIITLNREANEELITLFKPFGKLSFRNQLNSQEMMVINRKGEALFKITYKIGEKEIRITLIDLEDRYLYSKLVRQLNKFNTCIYCQACNSTCSFGALSVVNGKYNIDEDKCVHCLNCVNKFDLGCLVASALKIKIKE
ncbi:MAG: phosphoadenosine phosphosulfate reductase family protein, partial [Fusobacteriaceae bacterium]